MCCAHAEGLHFFLTISLTFIFRLIFSFAIINHFMGEYSHLCTELFGHQYYAPHVDSKEKTHCIK